MPAAVAQPSLAKHAQDNLKLTIEPCFPPDFMAQCSDLRENKAVP